MIGWIKTKQIMIAYTFTVKIERFYESIANLIVVKKTSKYTRGICNAIISFIREKLVQINVWEHNIYLVKIWSKSVRSFWLFFSDDFLLCLSDFV